jgi:hypothetical protein
MFPLSTHDLLAAWDLGQPRNPVDRALVLLRAACPGTTPEALGELSIGERDARLLHLREITFGSQLSALAECPRCGERLELNVGSTELKLSPPAAAALSVDTAGYHVEFRLPNSADLAAAKGATDVSTARRRLFERCITNNVDVAELPEIVVDAVASAMSQADPQGDVRLALDCPACGQQWEEVFDIASFLWSEVHAWACRAFREVHQLASAYGWSEADILTMNPWRRKVYLELLGG